MSNIDGTVLGISEYPRVGQPIAPRAFREVLDADLPDWATRKGKRCLCELGEDCWSLYTREECKRLATIVANTIGACRSLEDVLGEKVVIVPGRLRNEPLDFIELGIRTHNCLARRGFYERLGLLNNMSICDLLRIRNFGTKCLVDFVSSLEAAGGAFTSSSDLLLSHKERAVTVEKGVLHEELTKQARLMKRYANIQEIATDDPRLGGLFKNTVPGVVDLGQLTDAILNRSLDPAYPDRVATEVESLRKGALRSKRLYLEDELSEILLSVFNSERSSLVIKRLGWNGNGVRTLQAVGDSAGITRERVRQIEKKATQRLAGLRVFAPTLDKALVTISKSIPDGEDWIMQRLKEEKITKECFKLRGVLSAARVLGRNAGWTIVNFRGAEFVVDQHSEKLPQGICSLSSRLVSKNGVANVEDIVAQINNTTEGSIGESIVISALQTLKGFSWLDEETGWFWLSGERRNRLLNNMSKIMSVCDEIGIGELREGARRHHRMQGFAPPSRVLQELCEQLECYVVDGSKVRAKPKTEWMDVLDGIEYEMTEILMDGGKILNREIFEKLCLERGINRNSFYVYLSYSPVIAQYAPGVYGIRGAGIAPGLAESLVKPRQPKKVLIDYGWTEDQQVWLGYRVSSNMTATGIFTIPAAMSKYLLAAGEHYDLYSEDDIFINNITCTKYTGWSLGSFFRRRGIEVLDYLVLVFDIKEKNVKAFIGAEELLDKYE